jgi:hypothetical protein
VLILDLDQTLIHATTALYVEGWLDDPDTRPEVCCNRHGIPLSCAERLNANADAFSDGH